MTLLKSALKIITVSTMLLSTSALASDFLVKTSFADPDDGSGSTEANGYAYDVNQMDVQWTTDDLITVKVSTDFIEHNNENGSGGTGNIVFGDLLMSTNGDDTPFNYAFVLSEGRYDDYSNLNNSGNQRKWSRTTNNSGQLTEITSTQTSKDYHGQYSNTMNGEVLADTATGAAVNGDWQVKNYGWDAENNKGRNDYISFSFNVSGITAFQNASQVAFSWAISCANDIVEGVVNVDHPNKVPEPATILLMLLALGFMATRRNNKAK